MITQGQKEQFQRDGFTVQQDFLSSDEVGAILREADEITAGNTRADHDATRMEMEPDQPADGTAVRRLYHPCSKYPVFKDLSESEKLLDCLEQLLGPNLLFHYSKLNMKPAEIGSVVEWHQDLSYYPLTNRDSLAVLFYLDDTTEKNGALRMLPGRHKSPLLDHSREGYFQGRVTEEVDDSDAVSIEGAAGTGIFVHGMTPHASAVNRSDRPRRTLILSYRAADAFSVFCGEMTTKIEENVRLVRGKPSNMARYDQNEISIPHYKLMHTSLYDLQERSREGKVARG